jgi:hypothetical protein
LAFNEGEAKQRAREGSDALAVFGGNLSSKRLSHEGITRELRLGARDLRGEG